MDKNYPRLPTRFSSPGARFAAWDDWTLAGHSGALPLPTDILAGIGDALAAAIALADHIQRWCERGGISSKGNRFGYARLL